MSGAGSFIPRSAGPVRQLASQGSLRPSSSPLLIRLELIKRQRKDGPSLVLFSVNHQCRFQSTSGKSESPNSKSPKQHPKRPPVPPLSTLIGQAIRQGFRNPFRGRTLRTLYRQNPIELTFALAMYVILRELFSPHMITNLEAQFGRCRSDSRVHRQDILYIL